MSIDHRHSVLEIPAEYSGWLVERELLGRFVGAAFDACADCQDTLVMLLVEDPATVALLVELACVSTRAAVGGLPAYLLQDGVPGPAAAEFRQLARAGGAAAVMVSVCEQMSRDQRRCAVRTAVDLVVGNLHLSRH